MDDGSWKVDGFWIVIVGLGAFGLGMLVGKNADEDGSDYSEDYDDGE